MFDRLKNRLDAGRQDGFTLIELLIVIVILGVLAGIVVFAVGGINDRGEVAACKSDYKTIQVAQEAAFAQTKTYLPEVATGADNDLVDKKFLASASDLYDVASSSATGYDIDPSSTGGCTYDPAP